MGFYSERGLHNRGVRSAKCVSQDAGGLRSVWQESPPSATKQVARIDTKRIRKSTKNPHRGRTFGQFDVTDIAGTQPGTICQLLLGVPLMPDGTIMGTLEFFVVTEPGQPAECDLDPPLSRGEVTEVTLRRPPPNARARQGVRGWKRPPNSEAACSQYPRVVLPLDDCALAGFLAEPTIDAANKVAKRSRASTNHESLTHPCCGLTKSGEVPTLHTIFWRAKPRVGDYVFCLGCGEVLRFDAALLLVLPDPGELDGRHSLAFLNAREHRPK